MRATTILALLTVAVIAKPGPRNDCGMFEMTDSPLVNTLIFRDVCKPIEPNFKKIIVLSKCACELFR